MDFFHSVSEIMTCCLSCIFISHPLTATRTLQKSLRRVSGPRLQAQLRWPGHQLLVTQNVCWSFSLQPETTSFPFPPGPLPASLPCPIPKTGFNFWKKKKKDATITRGKPDFKRPRVDVPNASLYLKIKFLVLFFFNQISKICLL